MNSGHGIIDDGLRIPHLSGNEGDRVPSHRINTQPLTSACGKLKSYVRADPSSRILNSATLYVKEDEVIDDLYELIGGRHTVWAATESFYRRVLQDESLRHFFGSTDMPHLRARQSMFISMLLGGRIVYTGKEIGAAHARAREQGLTDEHYDAFLKHFRAALDEVGVKPENAEKVLKLLEGKRGTVLNR